MPKAHVTYRLCIIICLLLTQQWTFSQCSFVFNERIPDNGEIELTFRVDDLVTDDLAAGQGVCGVNLAFNHPYLGDLTIELESPAGQVVKLVGPVTDQISATNLTNWDVGFVRCADVAAPDAGFTSVWNNEQAWQVFTTYTGTYQPAAGCLEDFNSGSANGTWVLRLGDADDTAVGELVSVELIFCDDTGLSCVACEADAGEFMQQSVTSCEGTNLPGNTFDIDHTQGPPDPDSTNFIYVISSGGPTYSLVSVPSFSGWDTGVYDVCGISYAVRDSAELFDQLDLLDFNQLQDAFSNEQITACADITPACLRIVVQEIPDPVFIDAEICEGKRYKIGDEVFTDPGQYQVELTSVGGCDSIVNLDLAVIDVVARIAQIDTLTCDNQIVELTAASSTVPGNAKYRWSTIGGIIVGPANSETIEVSAPGIYAVTVTSQPAGCKDVRSWEVITDGSQPVVVVDDVVLDCNTTSEVFDPFVFPSDVSFNWSGPGGFQSVDEAPQVNTGGTYWVTVTDATGCVAVQSAEVLMDTVPPQPEIRVIKDCIEQTTRLVGRPREASGYSWSGPGGFTSVDRIIHDVDVGMYSLTIIGDNGCPGVIQQMADGDYAIPDVDLVASDDSIDCGEIITINATSSVNDIEYTWSGFGVNATGVDEITVFAPGEFFVEGLAPNGCTGYDSAVIYAGPDLPQVLTFTDTITCLKDTVSIGVVTQAAVIDFDWSGPGLVDSTSDFVSVIAPGQYNVVMQDIDGCILYASVSVGGDLTPINFREILDTITCSETDVEITFEAFAPVQSIEWEYPNGDLSSDSIITVQQAGEYTLTVSGLNGCESIDQFEVPIDTLKPRVVIEPVTFGCVDSVQMFALPIDSITGYNWNGPSAFSSDHQSPFIYQEGLYALTATGVNGCERVEFYDVPLEADPPQIDITTELLDCIDSVAVLEATSVDTQAVFAWVDPTDQLLEDSSLLTVRDPGMYIMRVVGGNNCVGRDTVIVEPPVTPAIFADEDTINCRDSELTLTAMSDSANMVFTWFDVMGSPIGTGADLLVDMPGTYVINGVWTNGCTSDSNVVVHIDTLKPVAIAITDQVIRCEIQDIYLSGILSIGDSLTFDWRGLPGDVLAGEMTDSAFVSGEGVYVLSVEEVVNHCRDTDTIRIAEEPSTLQYMDLIIVPECQDNNAGAIIFDSVYNADSPLLYSIGLNGGSTFPRFDSLAKGQYNLTVIDSFGCRIDTTIFVTETSSEATVNLGPDFEIRIGDQAVLTATLDVDSSALSEIFWDPQLPCDGCLSNTDYPLQTQDYTIYVRDQFGCLAEDEVRVYVVERAQVYVPNVFSPNGDGTNDILELTAHPGVREVLQFRIFDRWGNQLFGVENVDPHAQSIAWDGLFQGKQLNPAVYGYLLEVELITGRTEYISGDITLLR